MKTIFTPFSRISVFGFLLMLASMVLPVSAQTSHVVDVTTNVFTPDQLTISIGDTVIWTNSQGNHNVNGTQETNPGNPESFGNSVGAGWTFVHVFTLPGTYDYQCDPHVGWGMVGQVVVEGSLTNMLTINFTAMTPHVGQTLWLSVKDRDESEDILRMSRIIEESFSIEVPGIVAGNDYRIEFFADHNGNGAYDDPPADHAWRYDLDEVSGNEVLAFTHNTNFNDIDWDDKVVVNLSGMTPHVGQEIYFKLIDAVTGEVIDSESKIVEESFTMELTKTMSDRTYYVDFYSDHNSNGMYDPPPADHAWRLEFLSTAGDDTLNFTHNTDFTDISGTTSIRDRESDHGVSLYPNPAGDYVFIESDVEIKTVILYDSRGSRIADQTGMNSPLITFSLEGIQSGVYFLEVTTTDNQFKISRFIKK